MKNSPRRVEKKKTIEGENRANPVKLEAINKERFVRAID
jgi:hypothetical protein